jgi:SAM-dependent methyltransferase
VVAEAVTMFDDRPRAAAELARVCRPDGRVLATEFYWRRPPTAEAHQVFLGEMCPGLRFDSVEESAAVHADEGAHAAAVMARGLTRPAYLRKMVWLMPRMARAVPYLGYVLVIARKPDRVGSDEKI